MRKENPLFIAPAVEGVSLNYKHPAFIKTYAVLTPNKTAKEPLSFVGIDIETNHLTAEWKLLGIYKDKYSYYDEDIFNNFLKLLYRACDLKYNFVYWRKLDPFIIFKSFLLELSSSDQQTALLRYDKEAGNYTRRSGWITPPLVSVKRHFFGHDLEFGIMNVIRGAMQFYVIKNGFIMKTWSYDIQSFYENSLETEGKRFSYYSKIDEESHLVDWKRYETDVSYQAKVLKSNENDSHAAYDLANLLQDAFFNLTGKYAKSYISSGSLCRAFITSKIDYKILKQESFTTILDNYYKQHHYEVVNDFYSTVVESYSAGCIEVLGYGFTNDAYISDLTSAYPASFASLSALHGSRLEAGRGNPPKVEEGDYCFIRGTVTIPEDVLIHPLTIKHPLFKDTNVRMNGTYIASYTIIERDFLFEQGATFKNEEWFIIHTWKHPHPIGTLSKEGFHERMDLKAKHSPFEFLIKKIINSYYGIHYEAVPIYAYDEAENKTYRVGLRAGEFWNPVIASYITSITRTNLCRATIDIQKNGGIPLLLMTDSVMWKYNKNALPSKYWTKKKSLGMFEEPSLINNVLILGTGRYEYMKEETLNKKTRGFQLKQTKVDDNTHAIDTWKNVIEKSDTTKVILPVRTLISPQAILMNHDYNINQIGLVMDTTRDMDLVVGLTKRDVNIRKITKNNLLKDIILTSTTYQPETDPIYDSTKRKLRNMIIEKPVYSTKEKKKKSMQKLREKTKKNDFLQKEIKIRS